VPTGVLLRGPSGAGKSDLALRLIERGWSLIADDQCELSASDGRLVAQAPEAIAGKLEVRGLGIVEVPHKTRAVVGLLVDLVSAAEVERLPEPETCDLLGVAIRRLSLDAFDASAVAKLDLALHALGAASEYKKDRPAEHTAANGPPKDGADHQGRRPLVFVTGFSGAGRSSALNTLEDLGYEAIDNLPLELLDQVLADGGARAVALGIDIRTRNFAVQPFLDQLDRLAKDPALAVTLLFLHCDDEELRRRFTETRRRHPLAQDRPLIDGIVAERRLVLPLRDRADLVIDTTGLTPNDFRHILIGQLALDQTPGMALFVMSFAYRRGLPRSADMVFDLRFLENPHYNAALRPLSGKDRRVADFIQADPDFKPFFRRLTETIVPLLPRFAREGKSYLTLALGCTGGRHRSVMVAEALAAEIRDRGWQVTLVHRDLGEENMEDAPPEDLA